MATFIGYNSIGQYKSFTLTDFELIKRNILNALNIREGESVMRPLNGTKVWDYIFDQQTPETVRQIEKEIERVVKRDPRVVVKSLAVYGAENGILVELQLESVATAGVEDLIIRFDQETNTASYV